MVTEYAYDALYRQTSRTDPDGTATYVYDANGNMTEAGDDSGTVGFAYDALNRTTAVTNEDATTTGYTYDAAGNRLSITYPDGKTVTTAYDLLGNVTALTDHDGKGIRYTRDAEGRATKESHSDGSTTEYTYNAAGLLTQQKEVDKHNTTRREILYGYDDAGNLKSEQRTGVDFDKRDENVRYIYDKANQLVKTTVEGVTTEYQYDLAGNLLSDGKFTYIYDLQNRLLSKTGTAGTTTYAYDAAGNLLKETTPDGLVSYTYTAQNKLETGANAKGETSTYTYNALGVRIQNVQVRGNGNAGYMNALLNNGSIFIKDYMAALSDGRNTWQRTWETEVDTTVQNDRETVTKHYVADYLSLANRDIMVTEDGSYTQRYVYDENSRRISAEFDYAPGTQRGEPGENIASDTAAELGKFWYRTSLLGSTLFAVDESGEVVSHAIYDPWGNPLTETYTDTNFSGIDNLNNFTGYTWDETLGLYFAQNRFYDATTHRFTQQDPAKYGANWYVYGGNNPVNAVDPLGLMDYFSQTDDLFLGIGRNLIGQAKAFFDIFSNIKFLYELGKGFFTGEISLWEIGKLLVSSIIGPWKYCITNIGVLNPFDNSYTDSQVQQYGENLGSVLTDVVGVLIGANASKITTYLAKSATGQKLLKLINTAKKVGNVSIGRLAIKAVDYFSDLVCSKVWTKSAFKRGQLIDSLFNNLGANFPVVDRLKNGILTSVKSIDLGSKTYQNSSKLLSTLKGYVNDLSSFTQKAWGGVEIKIGDYHAKELLLAIPDVDLSNMQTNVLNELSKYAASKNIKISIAIIK